MFKCDYCIHHEGDAVMMYGRPNQYISIIICEKSFISDTLYADVIYLSTSNQYFGQTLLALADQSKTLKVHYVDYVERSFLMP